MASIRSQTLFVVLLLNLVNGTCVALSQELDPDDFKSRKASRAVKSYVRAIEKASKEFAETEQTAREELTASLEDALKEETQKGNLEEALKLKETMELIETVPNKPTGGSVAAHYAGLWRINYTNGVMRYYAIQVTENTIAVQDLKAPDSQSGRPAKVKLVDGALLIDFSDKKLDRLNYSNGRLYVEHWNLTRVKDTNAFPSEMAIGIRVDK